MQNNNPELIVSKEIKLFPYKDFFPKLHKSVFLASGSKIIGDVEIGENTSVWYNTVIRGDVNYVRIGNNTNVQDNSMLHVTNQKFPLVIGNGVTIGHSVTLHGCTLNDYSFVGMGAVILDGAVIESHAMVAAGAVIKQGFIVPAGKLAAGVPAKVIRDLTDAEMDEFEKSAARYVDYTSITVESLLKHNYSIEW